MAAFPSYPIIVIDGYTESHAPIADRSDTDRGVPKQRRTQSDVMVTISFNMIFTSLADIESFETWYYDDAAAGGAWFDFTHPRTGALVSARVVANTLGTLYLTGLGRGKRTLQVEYLKALTL